MRAPNRIILRLLPVTLLLFAASCDESNNVFVEKIGTVKLLPTSPFLGQQRLNDDTTMQTAEWTFTSAKLTVNGAEIDLLVGDTDCRFVDTAVIPPTGTQRCINGIVVDSFDEIVDATVDLAFTLTFGRAEPLVLDPFENYDEDSFANGRDACPLVPNDRPAGLNCKLRIPSGALLNDNDGDLIDDSRDNCVWTPNSDQTNTMGLAEEGFNDFIGDACETQEASVFVNRGGSEIVLTNVPIKYTQAMSQASYIVVEIDHRQGVTCNFATGICLADESAIKVCQQHSLLAALVGCSDLDLGDSSGAPTP